MTPWPRFGGFAPPSSRVAAQSYEPAYLPLAFLALTAANILDIVSRGTAELVLLAADTQPLSIVLHIPLRTWISNISLVLRSPEPAWTAIFARYSVF